MTQISSQAPLETHISAPHPIRLVQDGGPGSAARVAPGTAGWRILVVDGDADFSDYLVTQLRRHGHESVDVKRGSAALQAYEDVDLVLLDLELPDLDGLEVCRAIRSVSRVPVIIVTSRQSELDCVLGLQAGADDYVTRPYGLRELMARIEAVMRRAQWQPAAVKEICIGRLRIDVNSREVTVSGVEVALTRKEFDLLCLLASHPDTVIPRKQLLQQVWGDSWSRRTVDTHVSSLRGKLGDSGWIVTVRGVGFKLGTA
ncbi:MULTISPECIES: response regulator transcription factor [unclassified Streptomyces]|uniref:response regulator transcription factor n=1 Tax=unclassified Streptomyces TaxID=2593676 RepID=UPI001BE624F1|nr:MULTISPECIES: response regulator transcription factor [unclassified Streptomyces]MBT2402053.1 response regulator transcription factor [Streptomyces sp. ISL-21]MBT2609437.1 response regulator transcription factor [Streptomyces sp. ISL-87]